MPTPFDQFLADLQEAQGDPAQLALVSFEFAVRENALLRAAVEAAAIPHWFQATTLPALLPEHAAEAPRLLAQLCALPMVEPYDRGTGAEPAWNIHETTRLALRNRMWEREPDRFRQLSERAAAAYGTADPDGPDCFLTCEHAYHRLAGQTAEGDAAFARVADQWSGEFRTERLQALARLVEELLSMRPTPPLQLRGQGWAWLTIADAREAYQPVSATKESLLKAEAAFQHLVATEPENSFVPVKQRDLSVSYDRLGDVAVALGDLPAAQRAFGQSLAIRERLTASDPQNAGWQYDLSVSYNKLGDVAVARGDLAAAERAFAQDLAIAERLAASDPQNAGWQRDLSVSYGKLGDVAEARGDLPGAQRAFSQSLAIAVRLAASDPQNAEWQRDLSISYEKLGDVAVAQGDLAAAQRAFGQSHAITERLAASDPQNAEWQSDLSVSYGKLGDVAVEQEELPAAQRAFAQSRAIVRRLAASDPQNAGWQRDVSITYGKLGDVAVAQGNLPAAQRAFAKSLAIAGRLAASDPQNAEWQRDLFVSYWRLADLTEEAGEERKAREYWQKAHDVLAGMKARGMHLSPQDERNLRWLKGILGL